MGNTTPAAEIASEPTRFPVLPPHFMKPSRTAIVAALGLSLAGLNAQEINNADFSHGKAGWQGDGKAVYFDAAGQVSEIPTPGSVPGLKFELNKNSWKQIKQSLRAKPKETDVSISVQVMADTSFKRVEKSREFSKVDFGEGGGYVWSALVYPECDFLIRVKDGSWFYRPLSLKPAGTWKTLTADFPKLEKSTREIALLFPPGEGTVYIKGK